jgi:predicted AlkP superfamily phosphohydrolase/phosphomutase
MAVAGRGAPLCSALMAQESTRLAVVGLDGATFRSLDPLVAQGVMPALGRLIERGARMVLRSTVPTYTPPAWVSMSTGVNPGRHGVFGFLAGTSQEPVRIAHAGLIDAPPMWRYLAERNLRAGVFNVPMYYPPEPVEGFMVAGGLAAGWTETELPNFSTDEAVTETVARAAGGRYPLDTVVTYENDWNKTSSVERITQTQQLRRRVLNALLERIDVDVVFAVFEGVDRLQHLHYQYIVECSEWYGRPEAGSFRDRALEYFTEVDRAVDDLVSWAGRDGHVMIVSDHGFGPWEKTLNLNILLSSWGYTHLPAVSRLTRARAVAGAGQRLARRVVPRPLLHRLKARVQGGIDWERSRAFASHIAEQGLHINTAGELPHGIVAPGDASSLERELSERLLAFHDTADGKLVVDRIVNRDEAIWGSHATRSPHLFPFCRDQRYELSDTLAAHAPLTDHRDRPWGYHHIDGVLVAAGPRVGAGSPVATADIVDVLPTAFHLLGLPVPEDLDGRVVAELLDEPAGSVTTARYGAAHARSETNPYSAEEERSIEESLRGLGYLE